MTTSHSFADLYQEKVTPEVLREMENSLDINYQKTVPPLDLEETSFNLEIPSDKEAGIPALTPIMDTIDGLRSIDWPQVRIQLRNGVNNVGIAIAIISEKTHAFGRYLSQI